MIRSEDTCLVTDGTVNTSLESIAETLYCHPDSLASAIFEGERPAGRTPEANPLEYQVYP